LHAGAFGGVPELFLVAEVASIIEVRRAGVGLVSQANGCMERGIEIVASLAECSMGLLPIETSLSEGAEVCAIHVVGGAKTESSPPIVS
jgi:hypothetical protein